MQVWRTEGRSTQPDLLGQELSRHVLGERSTPLHAARKGHVAAVLLLLENGADISAEDELEMTPLHRMMRNDNPGPDSWYIPVVKILLEFGPNTVFYGNATLIHVAINYERDVNFIEFLVESGIYPNSRTVDGRAPLSFCIETNDMDTFKMLVKAGADAHLRDEDERSLFQLTLETEMRAWLCLPTLLKNELFTLDSDAGDGRTLLQFLREESWMFIIRHRVNGMPEVDEL
ncbi:hypothetical protein V493_06747 [Pseudogymnoascus sp. VKM F-4281 (FW-2241)]|nr:hypothetical protein V493_06747 [Pseudogymnoascus sp. VKM F-4281 (FW-2241)]